MLTKKIAELLKEKEFIHVATSGHKNQPNAAPKFLLKIDASYIYLVDYSISRTWDNIKNNPSVSLSAMDTDTLTGYQINGPVEIIEKGDLYEELLNEFKQKEISLSAKRIVEGVAQGKTHKSFEVALPEKVVFFKVKIDEVAEIGSQGSVKREKI